VSLLYCLNDKVDLESLLFASDIVGGVRCSAQGVRGSLSGGSSVSSDTKVECKEAALSVARQMRGGGLQ